MAVGGFATPSICRNSGSPGAAASWAMTGQIQPRQARTTIYSYTQGLQFVQRLALLKKLGQSFSIRGCLVRYQQAEWRSVATSPSIGGATTDSKLASDAPDVLPLLAARALEDTLRRLPPQAIRRTLRHGVVPVAWRPDHLLYATCGPRGATMPPAVACPLSRGSARRFSPCVRQVWGRNILRHATYGLFASRPQFSARRRVTLCQMVVFLVACGLPRHGPRVFSSPAHLACGQCGLGLFFLSVVALRLFCLFPLPSARNQEYGHFE